MKGKITFVPVAHDPFAGAKANLPKGELGLSQGPMGVRDWLPFIGEALKQYGGQKVNELLGAVTAPGDVLRGALDPNSPEGQARIAGLAGLAMTGGGAPSGAVASGWGAVNRAIADSVDASFQAKVLAQFLAADPEAKTMSVSDVVKKFFFNSPEYVKAVKEVEAHPLAPSGAGPYEHPYGANLEEHPAMGTYTGEPLPLHKKGGEEAGFELLGMLQQYPELYKSAADAAKKLASDSMIEPEEIPTFAKAALHLDNWAKAHSGGEFKFGTDPKAKAAPFAGNIMDHPALVEIPTYDKKLAASSIIAHMAEAPFNTVYDATNDFISKSKATGSLKEDLLEGAEWLQNHLDLGGSLEFAKPKAAPSATPYLGGATAPSSSIFAKPSIQTGRKLKSPEESLYEVNWNDLASPYGKPYRGVTGELGERLARARELGFNTELPLFKGIEYYGPKEMEQKKGKWVMADEGPMANTWSDPRTKPRERGLFAADTPLVSNKYAGTLYSENYIMFGRPKNVLAADWMDFNRESAYAGTPMHAIIEAARQREADALILHGMRDVGGPQSQYVFLKNNLWRSPFAAFDPDLIESSNLLHSGGLPWWAMLPSSGVENESR